MTICYYLQVSFQSVGGFGTEKMKGQKEIREGGEPLFLTGWSIWGCSKAEVGTPVLVSRFLSTEEEASFNGRTLKSIG